MELRVHNEVGALKTPTGYIPKYEDLRKLFKQVLRQKLRKRRLHQTIHHTRPRKPGKNREGAKVLPRKRH